MKESFFRKSIFFKQSAAVPKKKEIKHKRKFSSEVDLLKTDQPRWRKRASSEYIYILSNPRPYPTKRRLNTKGNFCLRIAQILKNQMDGIGQASIVFMDQASSYLDSIPEDETVLLDSFPTALQERANLTCLQQYNCIFFWNEHLFHRMFYGHPIYSSMVIGWLFVSSRIWWGHLIPLTLEMFRFSRFQPNYSQSCCLTTSMATGCSTPKR